MIAKEEHLPLSTCRICEGASLTPYSFEEKMFGTCERFDYVECDNCGCLQISEFPVDMSRHYPSHRYYSLEQQNYKSPFRSFSRRARANYAVFREGLIGKFLFGLKKTVPELCVYGEVGIKNQDRILDVGGGAGQHTFALRCLGVENALAIDKFIQDDIELEGSLLARKATIEEMEGEFDLIIFHHSFEHMEQQVETLEATRSRLSDHGRIVLRIPSVSSYAWEHYRENWVNLDAPRHFFLHSHESIKHTAERANLKMTKLWCDSTSFQFWGSEQYKKGIILGAENSYAKGLEASTYLASEIEEFEHRAKKLNQENRGDWICVLLEK